MRKRVKNYAIIISFIVFSGLHVYSQDIVKFNNGDSVKCHITKVENDTIFYQVAVSQNIVNTFLPINKLSDYHFEVISKIKTVNDTSVFFNVIMNDGNTLSGKIKKYNKNSFIIEDLNFGEIKINPANVKEIVSENMNELYHFKLINGNELYGKIVKRTKSDVIIESKTLGTVTLPYGNIKSMNIAKEGNMVGNDFWFSNPNNTRYYFAPSAYNLKKGEAYYQNVYLIMNSANYGITDNISIGGGVILPFAVYLTPKISFKITERFHAGVGVFAGVIPGPSTFGIGYGLITYGSNEHNLTIGTGYGFFEDEVMKHPIVTINGMTRISKRIALVTENWMIPDVDRDDTFNTEKNVYRPFFSFGLRTMWEKITLDFALVNGYEISEILLVGLPYIDFVYKF